MSISFSPWPSKLRGFTPWRSIKERIFLPSGCVKGSPANAIVAASSLPQPICACGAPPPRPAAPADKAITIARQTDAARNNFQHIQPRPTQRVCQPFIRCDHGVFRYDAQAALGIPLLNGNQLQPHPPGSLQQFRRSGLLIADQAAAHTRGTQARPLIRCHKRPPHCSQGACQYALHSAPHLLDSAGQAPFSKK